MKYLYELRWDDGGRTLRYAGTTQDPAQRYRGHRSDVKRNKHGSPKVMEAWKRLGEPEMVVLAALEDSEAYVVEDRWLEKRAQSPGLLNEGQAASPGNDGVIRERRNARIREACCKPVELVLPDGSRKVWDSLTHAARAIGVPASALCVWLKGRKPWPGAGALRPRKFTHLTGLTGRYLTKEEWLAYNQTH